MKMLKTVLLSVSAFLLLACSATQKIKESNASLDEMMDQKAFEIKVRSAEPQLTQALGQISNSGILPPGSSAGRIDVAGSGYFIKVQGDSVSANLPYYGERQMGGGYNSDTGITFKGLAKDLEISKNETKKNYTVRFSIDSKTENYVVLIAAGTRLTSTTSVRSSQRNRIQYTGDVVALRME